MSRSSQRGQSAAEEALLLAAIVAALVGLMVWFRLVVQGRLHAARVSLLAGETPWYGQAGPEFYMTHSLAEERVAGEPVDALVRDPLLGVPERQRRTKFSSTVRFREWIWQ